MHLAIHPARSGVPAHSQALLSHLGQVQPRPPRREFQVLVRITELIEKGERRRRGKETPQEQKYAEMRERMAKLREKGIIA